MEDTVTNMEVRGKVPQIKSLRKKLSQSIGGVWKRLEG